MVYRLYLSLWVASEKPGEAVYRCVRAHEQAILSLSAWIIDSILDVVKTKFRKGIDAGPDPVVDSCLSVGSPQEVVACRHLVCSEDL